jgi:SAM-dependent methyltransferase
MEHCEEAERLKRKTRRERVIEQACWGGLQPGMRVLDVGCGGGYTTSILAEISATAEGLDLSRERIEQARIDYPELKFHQADIYGDLKDLGRFDFIWVRFFLEYHRSSSAGIVKKLSELLTNGGILCAGELDHHSMNHFPVDERMEQALAGLSAHLQKHADWDPYAGRKLYTHLYDAGLTEIDVRLDAHHLLFGPMGDIQEGDWLAKLQVDASGCGYPFPQYAGGFDEFLAEAQALLTNPRRFTYTPIILCRGIKPTG